MTDKVYIGVDVGQTGSIAFINPFDHPTVKVFDFDDPAALSHLQWVAETCPGQVKAVLEKVASHPGEGVSSSFKFGTNFGIWIGRLQALSISFDYVSPQRWKKAMFDVKPENKLVSIDRAMRLFPEMREYLKRKKDHNRAESLLLARYAQLTDT